MKHIKILLLGFLLCAPVLCADAAVYWIGRGLSGVIEESTPPEERSIINIYGHSFVAVIPDKPEELARTLFPQHPELYFEKLEKNFGAGKKGFLIGGYPGSGSAALGHMDGNLELRINEVSDFLPTKEYFAGQHYDQWRFVGGPVEYEGMTDTEACAAIYRAARRYQRISKSAPIDYNAVHSVTEELIPGEDSAQNCNALAFSVLAYSWASRVPDIGAERVMPGNRKLLPSKYFVEPGIYPEYRNPHHPRVFAKDDSYRKRFKKAVDRAIRNLMYPHLIPLQH